MSKRAAVHRGIVLVSPPMKGRDVKALQVALNERLDKLGLEWLKIKADSTAGRKTMRAAAVVGWAIGLHGQPMQNLRKRDRCSRYAQRVIRKRRKRTASERRWAERRRKAVAKMRKRHNDGAAAAVRWARRQEGKTEQPAGSNRGPGISEWQRRIIGYDGVPWCGCFVGVALIEAGVKGINSRIAYTPYIIEDGRRRRYGMRGIVAFENARPGDLVVFNFPGGSSIADHVGLAIAKPSGGYLKCEEGNTSSSSSGSQSNGGGVFERNRPKSQIAAIVRPAY